LPVNQTTKRRRRLPGASRYGKQVTVVNGVPGSPTVFKFDYSGTQYTESEGHQFPVPKGTGLIDSGGPFYTTKSYCKNSAMRNGAISKKQSSSVTNTYVGHAAVPVPEVGNRPQFPTPAASSDAQLNVFGATAIARCAPANPPSNVVTFLGELMKDGLPSLIGHETWQNRSLLAKSADNSARYRGKTLGSEFLNKEFGWDPMLNDINKFANALLHADKVLEQYERDAGQLVRRRYKFPTTRSSVDTLAFTGVPASGPNYSLLGTTSPGNVIRTRETVTDRWFSGAFTYYLPTGYDSRESLSKLARQAQFLLGAHLSPDVLWELAPWSWAVDWFSNMGDVIHNVSRFATGGLIMPYGYMMEHSIITDTYRYVGATGFPSPFDVLPPTVLVTETKKRVKANPYGFGVTWGSLSGFQYSIMAALGLSRGRR